MGVLRAVVTGASPGSARRPCARSARVGWEVVGVARREDRLRALAEETGHPVRGRPDGPARRGRPADHLAATGPCTRSSTTRAARRGSTRSRTSSVDDWAWMFEVNVLALNGSRARCSAPAPGRRRAGRRRHREHHVDRRSHRLRGGRRVQRGEVRRARADRGAPARAERRAAARRRGRARHGARPTSSRSCDSAGTAPVPTRLRRRARAVGRRGHRRRRSWTPC